MYSGDGQIVIGHNMWREMVSNRQNLLREMESIRNHHPSDNISHNICQQNISCENWVRLSDNSEKFQFTQWFKLKWFGRVYWWNHFIVILCLCGLLPSYPEITIHYCKKLQRSFSIDQVTCFNGLWSPTDFDHFPIKYYYIPWMLRILIMSTDLHHTRWFDQIQNKNTMHDIAIKAVVLWGAGNENNFPLFRLI